MKPMTRRLQPHRLRKPRRSVDDGSTRRSRSAGCWLQSSTPTSGRKTDVGFVGGRTRTRSSSLNEYLLPETARGFERVKRAESRAECRRMTRLVEGGAARNRVVGTLHDGGRVARFGTDTRRNAFVVPGFGRRRITEFRRIPA